MKREWTGDGTQARPTKELKKELMNELYRPTGPICELTRITENGLKKKVSDA